MATTLDLFWPLSSSLKQDRIGASIKLILSLQQFQSQFTPSDATSEAQSSSEDEQEPSSPTVDPLDSQNSHDVAYSIRRLVRGLASPRESSRIGFSVALTELLSRLHTVSCSRIIDLVLDSTKPQGSISGQEERDLLFARLFGFTAIIQSGLFVRTKPIPHTPATSSIPSSLKNYEEIVIQLLALGEKKSWLRESAWWTLHLALGSLEISTISWKKDALAFTVENIIKQDWSPEKVATVLRLQFLHPSYDWKDALQPTFKTGNILGSSNLVTLARILKDSSDENNESTSTAPAGTWRPQLHFVWDIMLDELLPTDSSVLPSESFAEFFRVVIDESLFASNSSQERKYWGFQVFQKALSRVTADTIPMLFTKNLMRSLINHLSKQDRYLHKIAIQTVTSIQKFVEGNPHLGFSLILQLTGVNGSQQFDKLTRTKTVESILASLDSNGVKDYINFLLGQVNLLQGNGKPDAKALNSHRAWIIEQFAMLIRNGSIPKDNDWVQSVLDWLAINGLFQVTRKPEKSALLGLRSPPSPQFSDDLRQACRTRLLSCVADLSSQSSTKIAGQTDAVTATNEWVSKILNSIESMRKDSKHLSWLQDGGELDEELCLTANETVTKLSKVPGDSATGTRLLLQSTILQLYCGDNDATNISSSLQSCIDGANQFLPKMKKKKETSKTHEFPAIDILVDTIIGFLEQSTSYLRTMANLVFSFLAGSVTESSLDLILAQLQRRNPSELLDDGESDDSEADIGPADESSSSSSSSDAREDDEESDEESGEVDEELRQKIAEALRINGADDEESEEEDISMDDDQMMAIDDQLAAVFRSRVGNGKSKGTDAQREATHFKNRVLDLVDIFLKQEPTNTLIIRLILPLVELVSQNGGDEKQLSDKARGILNSRLAKSKLYPSVKLVEIVPVLTEVHTRARRVHTSDVLSLLSTVSLYLAKLLYPQDETALVAAYEESLTNFVTRKGSNLNHAFFDAFIRRFPTCGWLLRVALLESFNNGVNAYRQSQVYQLLMTVVSQISVIDGKDEDIISFMQSLQGLALSAINDACTTETQIPLKDVLKLVSTTIRQSSRILTGVHHTVWNAENWLAASESLEKAPRFQSNPSLAKTCKQITQTIRSQDTGKQSSKSKRKALDVVLEPADINTKRKRTKRSID